MSAERPEPETTFTPPEGCVGTRSLELRKREALGILNVRGLRPNPQPALLLLNALVAVMRQRFALSEEEMSYWLEVATVEGLEELVLQSAPQSTIHVPGRPS